MKLTPQKTILTCQKDNVTLKNNIAVQGGRQEIEIGVNYKVSQKCPDQDIDKTFGQMARSPNGQMSRSPDGQMIRWPDSQMSG